MSFTTFLIAPTIIFVAFVAPLWLILHYRSKKREETGLSEHERQQMEDLLVKLDKMTDRVETLEKILDERHGSWREKFKEEQYK